MGYEIFLTELHVKGSHHTGLPYSGTIGDRKRVYGVNVLPARQSKTLLRLITMAILDKMLVCTVCLTLPSYSYCKVIYQILLCIAAVVSLILSFFNSHASPANWVESVAIIVAVAIFVCGYSSFSCNWNNPFVRLSLIP